MTYTTLTISRSGNNSACAIVTLDRPDVRNAFNEITIAEITRAFRELGTQTDVRAIVLAANGP
ncbi:MAG: enoyl-CoA hydratase/isomerase family protein, partial [Rhodospirillaceae bacterium]|nr:enoyl-CoA hydratase/isomerase family protein [Rhodospirillaceae bacterium]